MLISFEYLGTYMFISFQVQMVVSVSFFIYAPIYFKASFLEFPIIVFINVWHICSYAYCSEIGVYMFCISKIL